MTPDARPHPVLVHPTTAGRDHAHQKQDTAAHPAVPVHATTAGRDHVHQNEV